MTPRAAVIAGIAAAGALAWLFRRQPNTTTTGEAEAEQDSGSAAPLWSLADLIAEAATPTPPDMADQNTAAFLLMIRTAEGTAGPNGYRTLFGGRLFDGWADHPRMAQRFTDGAGRQLWTSAAGAYQFMAVSPIPGGTTKANTWDKLAERLGLQDFSPASQDAAAVELIREAGALADVRAGRFDAAVSKVRRIWASMPGAGYAQPEKNLESLRLAYLNAGGSLA
ncbi:glycoside hydrolase family 24 protein [Roseateles violae]|uniref:Glycoside hydrolase family 104 protein n=1 Tax=Roseateles violae TaxID=3058042 RepID=A0ABT8E0H9_9BURK|nr:glycoside hydrolase family 104 protein [Pelomonas sp. PFR6]MDN3923330.1 glycoside hydrolase family 104 protein [Pelomonas sp. PFR6]